MTPTTNKLTMNPVTSQSARLIGSFGARLLTSLALKLWYNGFEGSVFGAILSLRVYISITLKSPQTIRIQPLQPHRCAHLLAVVGADLRSRSQGRRDGIDEASQPPVCDRPLGTVALVEDKALPDPRLAALPPQFRPMMGIAQAQQSGDAAVDPLLQDHASDEVRSLVELDQRTHNASKDRDRDRRRLTNGSALGAGPTDPRLGGGRRGADLARSVNEQSIGRGREWQD